jgi:predicted Rossmann fold nucleotide-binding protein DprA/Smf involved in DNA uptake
MNSIALTIVSGGQTGVDRAALDVAIARGIPVRGWCPAGRLAEDGPLSARYPLKETSSADYAERTRLNVRDSDGTLIISRLPLRGGTRLTVDVARELSRPLLHAGPALTRAEEILEWIRTNRIQSLNVAGPRASEDDAIYHQTARLLSELFDLIEYRPH